MPSVIPVPAARWRRGLLAVTLALVSSGLVALLTVALAGTLDLVQIALLYLLNVVFLAVWAGRWAAIFGALFGSLFLARFFMPPSLSLALGESSYLITAFEMLLVALVAGHLTAGLGRKAAEAASREGMLSSAYVLAADLAGAAGLDDARGPVERFLATIPGEFEHALLLNDETHLLRLSGRDDLPAGLSFDEAREACERGVPVERAGAIYLPLATASASHGVIAACWQGERPPLLEAKRLEMLASLATVTIERIRYADLARSATLKAEAEQLRSSILSALSHDIRTPLTSVVGLADALASSQPPLAAQQREMAQELTELAGQMNGMVSNLLDMARLQTGRLRLRREWQPLEEVVGVSLEQIRRRYPGRAIKVSIPPELPLLEFDTVLIERVICNLLENAIKFSPDGEILLQARARPETVAVTVLDEGPGIPPGSEERIFEPFVQVRLESSTPGVGLGLAICRTIVAAHGGEIRAETRREGGARIGFTLPRGTPPEAEEAPAEEGTQA